MEVVGACDTRDADLYHSVGHAIHDQAIAALPSPFSPPASFLLLHSQCFKSLAVPSLEAQQAHA
jgi:hypothetical protein